MHTRIILATAIVFACGHAAAGDRSGLVETRPAAGPAVETDQGVMVPFELQIPGTDVSFRMVPVPGGTFSMGSPADESGRKDDEGPVRQVQVAPFWMGECEVTWAEYKLFMALYTPFKQFQSRGLRLVTNDNRIDAITAPTPLYEPDFTFEYGDQPRQAAVSMTQYAARQYTKWLSAITGQQFRLPTEAEWEYACRAGSQTAWFFGEDPAMLSEYAWFAENSDEATAPLVRQKKPNPFGLYDIHGNAAEWVLDGYAPYEAADAVIDGNSTWVRSESPDPRVVRGGSWQFDAADCRSAARLGSDYEAWKEYDPNLPASPWWCTTDPARGVGFRLLIPLQVVPRADMEEYWKVDCEDLEFDVSDRLQEGRGVLGLVDKDLPAAIKALED